MPYLFKDHKGHSVLKVLGKKGAGRPPSLELPQVITALMRTVLLVLEDEAFLGFLVR